MLGFETTFSKSALPAGFRSSPSLAALIETRLEGISFSCELTN